MVTTMNNHYQNMSPSKNYLLACNYFSIFMLIIPQTFDLVISKFEVSAPEHI